MNRRLGAILILLLSMTLVSSTVADAARKVGEITHLRGKTNIIRQGRTIPARQGARLEKGDTVVTFRSSRAKLKFVDGTAITLAENSRFKVTEFEERAERQKSRSIFGLFSGMLHALTGRTRLEVHTPTAVAAARGTAFVVEVEEDDGSTLVMVFEDTVFVKRPGASDWEEEVKQNFMSRLSQGQAPSKPVLIPPDLMRRTYNITEGCDLCQRLNPQGECVPDNDMDPGPCVECRGGQAVNTDSEDPGECLRCQNGLPVPDNAEDPGMCRKCEGGQVAVDNTEDPGECRKCEGGQVTIDNTEDPGECRKCEGGNVVPDNAEDPGECRKCEGGNIVPDNAEDPGLCRKCEGGSIVPDNAEDPGLCRKCEGGNEVPDNLEDPGECQKCEGGSVVPDQAEDPGQCLKCEGGASVPDNTEDPGECFKCQGGAAVPDNAETCSDGDPCTGNDRCVGGTCEGGELITVPCDPSNLP